ncbi:Viral cathepsin [Papilio xuthus]|uniref:Viral cathepsin n=1 Tax=Papilio xuthus TaxID=66420 RepID=A0A194PM87_PAPXU|nr:Viral cathepsin [Papilio xuthus]
MSLLILFVLLNILLYAKQSDAVVKKPRYEEKDAGNLFLKFVSDYNKSYKNYADWLEHYEAFVQNLLWINYLNAIQDTVVYDINSMSDQTAEESRRMFYGLYGRE